MKVVIKPYRDFHALLWAYQGERPSLPVAVIRIDILNKIKIEGPFYKRPRQLYFEINMDC
jgi:hypothetical protein